MGGIMRNAVANQPQDAPGTPVYTCQDAQDHLNAPSTTVTCASGRAYWSTTCCIRRPSPVPSPAPIVHVPLDIERVKSEIRSFIHSSNLNGDVKLNELLQHLQPLFVGPINATSRDAIRTYAAEIAVKKIINAKKNR